MSETSTPAPGTRTSGGLGNLDQILIRIADVDRAQGKARAGARYRPEFNRNIRRAQLRDHLVQRPVREETNVQRSRRRMRGIAVGHRALVVEVDLLLAETQRLAPLAEGFQLQPQAAGVEIDALLGIARGQHQVIQTLDHVGSVQTVQREQKTYFSVCAPPDIAS